ncbi:hypothetical protein AJ78_05168 [Emergomyces pasteurianus Ep9510]|uniref:Uncharacterized protein n=1 Tax=Emergomyces pasteurianus Ep9510 TaxID=1447872 RepID=A0A1J9QEW7_9EURO|nr:hypothetical protein AJ78_05168 [Emergomyces pasteurianus Ep9510]
MDLESLSPFLRRCLQIRIGEHLDGDEATFPQEHELCDLLGVFPHSSDFTCLGQASTSGARCRIKIGERQRYIAKGLLADTSQTFPSICTNMNVITEKLERIASNLLCQRNHQKQTGDLARTWLLKIVQYRVLECDMRFARLESMLDPLVWRFNHIGEQLRAGDGRFSAEAFDAGSIQADEINLRANNDAAGAVAVVDVLVNNVDDEPAQGGAGPASIPHQPTAHPRAHNRINHAGSTLSLERAEVRKEREGGGEGKKGRDDEPTRMPIEGVCPICQEPLINTKVDTPLRASSSNSLHEPDELSYCSRLCGRNFHMACINSRDASLLTKGLHDNSRCEM